MFKKILAGLGVVTLLVFFFVATVGLQWVGIQVGGWLRAEQKDVNREVWENSNSRVRGAVQQIADTYSEYHQTNDSGEKTMLCNVLTQEYRNLPPSKIDDPTYRNFFKDCKYNH